MNNPYVHGVLTIGKCIVAVGVCFITYRLAGAYAWEAGCQARDIFSHLAEDVGEGMRTVAEEVAAA